MSRIGREDDSNCLESRRGVVAKRLAPVVAAAVLIASSLAIVRGLPPSFAVSDEALIEMGTLSALDGRQLVGAYSRYGWNHPGPLLFYALSPFYAAGGSRRGGLSAGALALNVAALALALWIVNARGGPAAALGVAAAAGVYLGRIHPLAISPWNAHVTIVPLLALLIAAAAADVRLVILVVLLASFVLQAHIALLPAVIVAGGAVVAGLVKNAGRTEQGRDIGTGRWAWAAAGLAVALWLPPLAEAAARSGGNLAALWEFARRGSSPAIVAAGFDEWALTLTAVIRQGLVVPTGGLLPDAAGGLVRAAAIAQIVAVSGVAWWARRRGETLLLWLAVQSGAVALAGLWALTRIPDGVHDHEVFWLSAVGVVHVAVMVAAALTVLGDKWAWVRARIGPAAAAVSLLLVAWFAVVGLVDLSDLRRRPRQARVTDAAIAEGAGAIGVEMDRLAAQRPLVAIDARVWMTAAGVILELRKRGVEVAVEPRLVSMFPGTTSPDGTEDVEISFCGGPCHETAAARPGNVVLMLNGVMAIDARPLP